MFLTICFSILFVISIACMLLSVLHIHGIFTEYREYPSLFWLSLNLKFILFSVALFVGSGAVVFR